MIQARRLLAALWFAARVAVQQGGFASQGAAVLEASVACRAYSASWRSTSRPAPGNRPSLVGIGVEQDGVRTTCPSRRTAQSSARCMRTIRPDGGARISTRSHSWCIIQTPRPLDQRNLLAGRIEELRVRIGARILIEVGDGSTFPTAGHLAAYAGLAPQPAVPGRRSAANSPPGEETSSSDGLSSSPRSPLSAPRPPGPATTRKSPRASTAPQALLCLAGRRAYVLFAMLRDGTFHEPQPSASAT